MEAHQKAYEELVTCITQAPVLKYFDVNEVVIVSVDALSEGRGAYLLQGNQPEACASRSLNSAKQNYAQIEKEMVAIVFGTSKFHRYICEKQLCWKLTTNPSRVCSKNHSLCRHRSAFSEHERMMLRVQQYKRMVKYRPGDQLHIADTLSRASQVEPTSQADEFEVHFLLQISKEKVDEFKRETDTHPVL